MGAFQNPNANSVATGTINPSVFVTASGSFEVAQSGSGDTPIGVSQVNTKLFNLTYAADAGDAICSFSEAQECWLLYGGTVSAGDRLKPDSSGRGVTAGPTDSSGALALEAGAINELHRVRVELVPVVSS